MAEQALAQPTADELMKLVDTFIQEKHAKNSTLVRSHIKRLGERSMGLFDKLKSLVSEDKSSSGSIEIIAPLSGEIVNIEDVSRRCVRRKNCCW